jgi:hypothetical protein
MGTKTVPNGQPHGPRDVVWGREVIGTVMSIAAVLLTILCLVVGAVVYNAREFAKASDANAAALLRIEKIDGDVKTLTTHLGDLVQKADESHRRYDKRLDDIEQWRYGQTISGWSPRRGRK